ncbi:MAG: hypothetical protein IT454_08855 [Planctomycetes bacterium]|nr:hypothetical protein [Planctomycetota bacterium]
MFDVRRVFVGLFIFVLASWIAALLLRSPTPDALHPPEIEAASAQAETPAREAWSSDESEARARTSVAPREPSSEASDARDESEPPPQLRELRGTYREFDPWGRDRAVETGSFRLTDEREHPVTIAVERGEWSAEVLGSAFEIGECTLAGDQAQLHAAAPFFRCEPGRELELVVLRRRPLRLRVVDADDGHELSRVAIARNLERRVAGRWPGPASSRLLLVSDASSPLELDAFQPQLRDQSIFVGARGYAWASHHISGTTGGERWIALRRGGDLNVAIEGADVPSDAVVRVFLERAPDSLIAVAPAASRELVIDALAPETYLVRLDVGELTWNSFALASERTTVVAGAQARAVLVVAALDPARRVRVEGHLVLSGWSVPQSMRLYRKEPPRPGGADDYQAVIERIESERDRCSWSVDSLEPGSYDVYLAPTSVHLELEVGPDGARDVELRLPERSIARVKLVDGDRGGLAELDRLGWIDFYEPWRRGGAIALLQRLPGSEWFEFYAPAHEIALWLNAEGYAFQRVPWKLAPGTNERELAVHRACGLHVTLLDDAEPRSLDPDWKLELRELDGRVCGYANPMVADEVQWVVAAPGPGRYRVHLEGLVGFRAVAPIEVEVRPERFDPLVIELERLQ